MLTIKRFIFFNLTKCIYVSACLHLDVDLLIYRLSWHVLLAAAKHRWRN